MNIHLKFFFFYCFERLLLIDCYVSKRSTSVTAAIDLKPCDTAYDEL